MISSKISLYSRHTGIDPCQFPLLCGTWSSPVNIKIFLEEYALTSLKVLDFLEIDYCYFFKDKLLTCLVAIFICQHWSFGNGDHDQKLFFFAGHSRLFAVW